MNNNSLLTGITERLSIVDIDIESQNQESKIDLSTQLRSILKKPQEKNDDIIFEKIFMKLCLALIVLMIMSPIAICDLYFGFSHSTCSREEHNSNINIQSYLIVTGFIGVTFTIIMLMIITCFDFYKPSNTSDCMMFCIIAGVIFVGIFNIIWTTLGAILFWGYIYENGNCNKTFSTYLFVSLIIKFVTILLSLNFKINKE